MSLAPLHPVVGQDPNQIPAPKGMQAVFVRDAALDMNAFEVIIPAKWHFQGTVVQGTTCFPVPFIVFRTTSPDGLTVLERLPDLDWQWGTSPTIGKKPGDCLPLKTAVSASDFLKYLSSTLKVQYLRDELVDPTALAAAQKNAADAQASMTGQYAANGMKPPIETVQMAAATVQFRNGSFMMKGLLSTTVDCRQASIAGPQGRPWVTNTCQATARYVHAPEAQYEAAVAQLSPKNVGSIALANWGKAWIANNRRQTQQNIAQIRAAGQAATARITASGQQFQHSQEVQQHMHDEFLSTMQRGTNMSMNQAAQVANANHTISSDWVDYSLDQQTVRDPATGQLNKVSSQYSYTWVDASGKTSYQTNDPNVNPNGSLAGMWTRQQVVHGDGTP
jgi:hypothetical protein